MFDCQGSIKNGRSPSFKNLRCAYRESSIWSWKLLIYSFFMGSPFMLLEDKLVLLLFRLDPLAVILSSFFVSLVDFSISVLWEIDVLSLLGFVVLVGFTFYSTAQQRAICQSWHPIGCFKAERTIGNCSPQRVVCMLVSSRLCWRIHKMLSRRDCSWCRLRRNKTWVAWKDSNGVFGIYFEKVCLVSIRGYYRG